MIILMPVRLPTSVAFFVGNADALRAIITIRLIIRAALRGVPGSV
jgi:hypothetical protein